LLKIKMEIKRCNWAKKNKLMIKYHDEEWGVPLHDDKKLFEFLVLETFQAGLSWDIILNKRENFREAFDGFDIKKIKKYKDKEFNRLKNDEGIVRNRLKIKSTIINAQKFLDVQLEFGSFDKYIWRFTDNKIIRNRFENLKEIPSTSKESDEMSKDLKRRGFKFVGSKVCYAFMQACGMVDDHLVNCFRYQK